MESLRPDGLILLPSPDKRFELCDECVAKFEHFIAGEVVSFSPMETITIQQAEQALLGIALKYSCTDEKDRMLISIVNDLNKLANRFGHKDPRY
jgi:hypothetical protein